MKYSVIALIFISLMSINKIVSMQNKNQKNLNQSENNKTTTPPWTPPHSLQPPTCPGAPVKTKIIKSENEKTTKPDCSRKLVFKD